MDKNEHLPLISFLLIVYNQENFIFEAVQSALAQTYQQLEIIISDDCSPDKTFSIIENIVSNYSGPHKVIVNRNEKNIGLAGNINRAWKLSSGDFIVMGAGDDIFLPDRVEKMAKRWLNKESPVDLVCSYFEEIDVMGKSTGYIKKEVSFIPNLSQKPRNWRCGATGACAGYSRKLFEKYGPLDERVMAEDWVLSFRAWVESGIAVLELPLVKHRRHESNISVIYRDLRKTTKNPSMRQIRRRQSEENQLAIAESWLQAWQFSGKKNHSIESGLAHLVKLRKMRLLAFDSSRTGALKIALLSLIAGSGLKEAAKIIARNTLRLV